MFCIASVLIRCSDLFKPLFEVTKDPRSHPELHVFLQRVVGFDTVDDESKIERRIHKKFPYPRLWDLPQSPPYSYWWVHIFDTSQRTHPKKGLKDLLHVRKYGKFEQVETSARLQ